MTIKTLFLLLLILGGFTLPASANEYTCLPEYPPSPIDGCGYDYDGAGHFRELPMSTIWSRIDLTIPSTVKDSRAFIDIVGTIVTTPERHESKVITADAEKVALFYEDAAGRYWFFTFYPTDNVLHVSLHAKQGVVFGAPKDKTIRGQIFKAACFKKKL